jgi:hypothetical protein
MLFLTVLLLLPRPSAQRVSTTTRDEVESAIGDFISGDPAKLNMETLETLWQTTSLFMKRPDSGPEENFSQESSHLCSLKFGSAEESLETETFTFVSRLENAVKSEVTLKLQYDGPGYFHVLDIPSQDFQQTPDDEFNNLVSPVLFMKYQLDISRDKLLRNGGVMVMIFHGDLPEEFERSCITYLKNERSQTVMSRDDLCEVSSFTSDTTSCRCKSSVWPDAIAINAEEPATMPPSDTSSSSTTSSSSATSSRESSSTETEVTAIESSVMLSRLEDAEDEALNGLKTGEGASDSSAMTPTNSRIGDMEVHAVKITAEAIKMRTDGLNFPAEDTTAKFQLTSAFLQQFQTGTVSLMIGTSAFPSDIASSEDSVSQIITAAVRSSAGEVSFETPIEIRIPVSQTSRNLACKWLDTGNTWSSDGCMTIADESSVTCSCSHLTSFAVFKVPEVENQVKIPDAQEDIDSDIDDGVSESSFGKKTIRKLPNKELEPVNDPKMEFQISPEESTVEASASKQETVVSKTCVTVAVSGISHNVALGVSSVNGVFFVVALACHILIRYLSDDLDATRNTLNIILLNAIFSAVMGSCLLVNFINETGFEMKCRVFAVLGIYFMGCSATWIFTFAMQTFRITRYGYDQLFSVKLLSLCCYGVPLMVAIGSFFAINPNQLPYCFPPLHATFIMLFPSTILLCLGSFLYFLSYKLSLVNASNNLPTISYNQPRKPIRRTKLFAYLSSSTLSVLCWVTAAYRYAMFYESLEFVYLVLCVVQNLALFLLFVDRINVNLLSGVPAESKSDLGSSPSGDCTEKRDAELQTFQRKHLISYTESQPQGCDLAEEAMKMNDHMAARCYSIA